MNNSLGPSDLRGYSFLQVLDSAGIRFCRYLILQVFSSTGIHFLQVIASAGIQVRRYSILQVFSSAGIRVCRDSGKKAFSFAGIRFCRYSFLQVWISEGIKIWRYNFAGNFTKGLMPEGLLSDSQSQVCKKNFRQGHKIHLFILSGLVFSRARSRWNLHWMAGEVRW